MVIFDLDLQGHLELKQSKSAENGVVHLITLERKDIKSHYFVYRYILLPCRMGMHMVIYHIDLPGHLKLKRSN